MTAKLVHQALAECIAAESQHPVFSLMGNANMHFLADLARCGTPIVKVHHENMAVAMADGVFRATGDVGVCSVTGGPGLSQIGNCLMIASRRRSSLVIVAGDSAAVAESGGLHAMNQRAFVEASGGMFHPIRSAQTVAEDVQTAFVRSRQTPGPVVLNAPVDIQELAVAPDFRYEPARALLPELGLAPARHSEVVAAVDVIAAAQSPVLLAGRGAMNRAAAQAITALAHQLGAALATTYPAKGLFADDPADIGVVGPYGSFAASEIVAASDCVVAFGASLSFHTTQDGRAFPNAKTVLVNTDPDVLINDRSAPDVFVIADVAIGAVAMAAELGARATQRRTAGGPIERFVAEPAALMQAEIDARPVDIAPELLDPRSLVQEIDAALPSDCVVVTSASHSAYFPSRFLTGTRERLFINTSEFGSIGHGISTGIGIACTDSTRPVVVFDGDGAAIMNIQELHTAAEYGVPLLVVLLNDEAYGSELHRMATDPEGAALSLMPSPDFVGAARAFGLRATLVTRPSQAAVAVADFLAGSGPYLIDARISRAVVRPSNLGVTAASS